MKFTMLYVIFHIVYATANSTALLESRVIGEIEHGSAHKFVVSVQIDKIHVCGGAIITTRTVITAATCIQAEKVDISIFAGSRNLEQNGTRFEVEDIIKRDRSSNELKNNLALLRTTKEIEYTADIGYILLPEHNDTENGGTVVKICGWGQSLVSSFVFISSNTFFLEVKYHFKFICFF